MVELLCIVGDGLVRLLLYLFWNAGLLRLADGLGRSLHCEVRMWLVGFCLLDDWLLDCDLERLGALGWVCGFVWAI